MSDRQTRRSRAPQLPPFPLPGANAAAGDQGDAANAPAGRSRSLLDPARVQAAAAAVAAAATGAGGAAQPGPSGKKSSPFSELKFFSCTFSGFRLKKKEKSSSGQIGVNAKLLL